MKKKSLSIQKLKLQLAQIGNCTTIVDIPETQKPSDKNESTCEQQTKSCKLRVSLKIPWLPR
jgi:hypothetical protein